MTLYVKPISALLTHDTEMFSNMDPYVVLQIGKEKKKTATHKEGGKKPKWNEVFVFQPKTSQMTITIYDEDMLTDDLVGSATLNLDKYKASQQEEKQFISLTYKGKSAGKIYMSIRYQAEQNISHQNSNWGTSNNQAWGNQLNFNQGWGGFQTNPQTGWGQPANSTGGWGQQPQNPSGWGQVAQQNTQSNWGQPQSTGWGQQQQQPYSGWGPNNNGWGNPQQATNPSGWGSPPNPPPNPPPANPYGNPDEAGWGNQPPPQGQQPDLIGLLANVLNNKGGNQIAGNSNASNNGWGSNNGSNNGW